MKQCPNCGEWNTPHSAHTCIDYVVRYTCHQCGTAYRATAPDCAAGLPRRELPRPERRRVPRIINLSICR